MNINKKIKTILLGLGLMAFLLLFGVKEAQCRTKIVVSCAESEALKVGSTVDAMEVTVKVDRKGGILHISTSDPSVATVAQDSLTLSPRTKTRHAISLTALSESREVDVDAELFKINSSGDEVFAASGSCSFEITN